MILIILKGGLGNQMFQYAFGLYLSHLYNTNLFLEKGIHLSGSSNRLYDLNIFNIPQEIQVGILEDLKKTEYSAYKIIIEKQYSYDGQLILELESLKSKLIDKDFLIVIDGYWQSYKYFSMIENIIRNSFCIDLDFEKKFKTLFSLIQSTNSIMVNVRRGDYLYKMDYHGVVDETYLSQSMILMEEKIHEPHFFIFSDDISWCRANIKVSEHVVFVDESYYDYKFQSYLKLMSNCKHFILSNSTFCWWAAWLADAPDKIVIAPKKWFATDALTADDLIPEEWITI